MSRQVGDEARSNVAVRLEELDAEWPGWRGRLGKLTKAGLEVSNLSRRPRRMERRHTWLAHVRPNKALQEQFALMPELAVLCIPWGEMHAEDIQWIEAAFRADDRLDPGLVLLIVGDRSCGRRLNIPTSRKYIFVHQDDWDLIADPQRWLRGTLREELGAQRLFDVRSPAEGAQYFGRATEFAELERYLLAGRAVGLWGLRKIGKTSLLRQLASKYASPSPEAPLVLLLDLTARPYDSNTLEGINAALGAVFDAAGIPQPGISVAQRLDALVRGRSGKVILAIDEYERLLDGSIPVPDGVRLLEGLRGLTQATHGRFSFVLTGRDPRMVAPARIGGRDNPMYRFLTDLPIGGLDAESAKTMVRRLGRRMGLDFGHDALDLALRETGGHPMLLRTLGDLVDRAVPVDLRNPYRIGATAVAQARDRFDTESGEDFRELLQASRDLSPDAQDLLISAAHGDELPKNEVARRLVVELTRFGVMEDKPAVRFRIGAFARWLSANFARLPRVANG